MSSPLSSDVSEPPVRRPTRHQIAAAATRREILLAARRLFAERGYAATSVVDIAEEAGVSVPTIYASIGPKKAVVLALADLLGDLAGASEAGATLASERDPSRLLALAAALNRRMLEHAGDILGAMRSAAPVEPDVAAAVARGKANHRAGAERIARRLGVLGALREGVDVDEARDAIVLLTDVDAYGILVDRCGWSLDGAEQWLTATLERLLL